jgi:hypothetical protein
MTINRIQSLEIPEDEQGILASLLRLSDPALDGLQHAIAQAVLTLDREDLISQLRKEPELAEIGDLAEIVGSLISIAGTAYSADVSTDEVLDVVVSTIRSDAVVDLTDSDAEQLKNRLARLAKSKSIEVIAKASELSRTNDRSFRSARIVSDLRPICIGEDTQVAAAVIGHQVAIRALRNGKRESTYFALDSSDLVALNAAVSRAIKKDKSLRQFATCSDTPILTPTAD